MPDKLSIASPVLSIGPPVYPASYGPCYLQQRGSPLGAGDSRKRSTRNQGKLVGAF